MSRIVGWFSCGNNSAVMSKMLVDNYKDDDVRIIRCVVANEHPDNDRFHLDVERWIGRDIERLASTEFADCWEVWEKRKFLSGIHGAPCTAEMKKAVRHRVEQEWLPDYQAFGFSYDEKSRADRFQAHNPEVKLLRPLETAGITKPMCAQLIHLAGIELPMMYKLGFANNNCRCCVKTYSIAYWARCRHFFPVEFARMVELSRRLNRRMVEFQGTALFLDEIPSDIDWGKRDTSESDIDCGVLCGIETKDPKGVRVKGFVNLSRSLLDRQKN